MTVQNRFLFIPVSSVTGIGEYMRSLIFANEVHRQFPNAEIKFILNRHTKYAHSCPFSTELLDDSPTKCSKEVIDTIEDYMPTVVVFDASCRKKQLIKAKAVGATTIFISQHKKKRSKGMKFDRARYIDFHFVAQPEFAIAPVNVFEKIKFKLLGLPLPECVGIFFNQPSQEHTNHILDIYKLKKKDYVLVNAGSGAHQKNGKYAADVFYEAAEKIAKQTELKTIMVMGPSYPNLLPKSSQVMVLPSLDNESLIALLANAKFVVLSGGGTLLQALELKVPVITCAVSKDQPARIKACEQLKLTKSVSVERMSLQVSDLLFENTVKELEEKLRWQPSFGGIQTIINRLIEEGVFR